ncbi:MAG: FecR domain-containing protein, partial [Gemmatimonadaceae bacterium]
MTRSEIRRVLSRETYDADDEAVLRAELNEPDTADYGLITRYLANELSMADRELVEERLRTDAKFRLLAEPLITIWNVPYLLDGKPDPVVAERAVEEFRKRVALRQRRLTRLRQKSSATWEYLRPTLIVLLFGSILGWLELRINPPRWFPVPSTYLHADAPENERRSETLPDETRMTLAPGAHVSYPRHFSSSVERTLNIDGEATFTVAPGPRGALEVDGPGVEVTASEGRFTIQAFAAVPYAYVKVHEGRAEVRARTIY